MCSSIGRSDVSTALLWKRRGQLKPMGRASPLLEDLDAIRSSAAGPPCILEQVLYLPSASLPFVHPVCAICKLSGAETVSIHCYKL